MSIYLFNSWNIPVCQWRLLLCTKYLHTSSILTPTYYNTIQHKLSEQANIQAGSVTGQETSV